MSYARGMRTRAIVLGLPLIVTLAWAASCSSEPAESTPSGCTRDSDCKGDRICDRGTCVSTAVDSSAGSDTTAIDTAVVSESAAPESSIDSISTDLATVDGPLLCDNALSSSFACVAPTKPTPSANCTETQIQDYLAKCIGADLKPTSACAAWQTANPTCNTCLLGFGQDALKTLPERDKCYWVVLSGPKPSGLTVSGDCATIVKCHFDCVGAICGDCDSTAGTGMTPTTSARSDCARRATRAPSPSVPSGGSCYAIASKDATACLGAYGVDVCVVGELNTPTGSGGTVDLTTLRAQAAVFYRGACRDNGDWSKSSASDAGTGG